jgi:hypothetical protein
MNPIRLAGLAIALTLVAGAQQNAVVAITHIEGKVYLDEKPVETTAILSGDGVVRTEGGRAEIHLRNGTVFLGENSSLQVFGNRPYNFNRLLMLTGSAAIATGAGAGLVTCEDTATLSDAGVFQPDLRQGSCRFRVSQGAASVQLASVATVLRTGKTMNLSRECGDMIPWNDFDLKDIDDLDRWSRASRK